MALSVITIRYHLELIAISYKVDIGDKKLIKLSDMITKHYSGGDAPIKATL